MQSEGNVEEPMMYNTYNMGIGMVLAVSPQDADGVRSAVEAAGEQAYFIGEIVEGERGIQIDG